MTMIEKGTMVDIITPKGEVVFSILIHEMLLPIQAKTVTTSTDDPNDPKKRQNGADHPASLPDNKPGKKENVEDGITDPQQRLLFRILAEQGKTGNAAYEHLKTLFHVTDLSKVSKSEASRMIDRLQVKKGERSNGSPVKQSN